MSACQSSDYTVKPKVYASTYITLVETAPVSRVQSPYRGWNRMVKTNAQQNKQPRCPLWQYQIYTPIIYTRKQLLCRMLPIPFVNNSLACSLLFSLAVGVLHSICLSSPSTSTSPSPLSCFSPSPSFSASPFLLLSPFEPGGLRADRGASRGSPSADGRQPSWWLCCLLTQVWGIRWLAVAFPFGFSPEDVEERHGPLLSHKNAQGKGMVRRRALEEQEPALPWTPQVGAPFSPSGGVFLWFFAVIFGSWELLTGYLCCCCSSYNESLVIREAVRRFSTRLYESSSELQFIIVLIACLALFLRTLHVFNYS